MSEPEERRKSLQLTKEEQKAIVKEAIQEWLDARAAQFGKWSVFWLASAVLGAIFFLWLSAHGFKG